MITSISLGLAVAYCYFMSFAMSTNNMRSTFFFKILPFSIATLSLVSLVLKHWAWLSTFV